MDGPGLIVERQLSLHIAVVADVAEVQTARFYWGTNRSKYLGEAELSWTGVGRFALSYKLQPLNTRGLSEGQENFGIVFREDVGGWRPFFQCRGCGRRAEGLFFHLYTWECRNCHGLVYATQRGGGPGRQAARYRELLEQVGEGRPQGMHHRRYDKLRLELFRLRQKLDQHPVAQVDEEWVFVSEVFDGHGPPMRYNPLPSSRAAYDACVRAQKAPESIPPHGRIGFASAEQPGKAFPLPVVGLNWWPEPF